MQFFEETEFEVEYGTYDSFNRMTTVKNNKGVTASYAYQANNLRYSKTVNGETSYFYWNPNNQTLLVDFEDGGQLTDISNIYSYGLQQIKNNHNTYYSYNGHGDVTALTNAGGNVTKTYDYDAFGVEIGKDETDTNPFRYCGEYFDNEINDIYLRNRYYTHMTGRFITEDPIRDGLNWYVYCADNPMCFMDSNGLSIVVEGSDEYKKKVFYNIQQLSDDIISIDMKTGVISYEAGENIEREVGTNLVRDLINNAIVCTIEELSDPNGYSIPKYNDKHELISTTIKYNPDFKLEALTENLETGKNEVQTVDSYIVLGHEMVHTIRRMNGIEPDRDSNAGFYVYLNENGEVSTKRWRPEELETTGISYYNEKQNGNLLTITYCNSNRFYYTENSLRRENGIGNRVVY